MSIPKIIADEWLTTCQKEWMEVVPTFRLEHPETHVVGRCDMVNGAWIERMIEDGPLYENATFEDVAVTYRNKILAIVRVRRVVEMPDAA